MNYKLIDAKDASQLNTVATHPLQSYEWGEFRQKTGVKVIRRVGTENNVITDGFTLTIHPVPYTKYTVGYLPKGTMPTHDLLDELKKIGKNENCIFIQLEPNAITSQDNLSTIKKLKLITAARPLFTKFSFLIDLTLSDEELLKKMHPKTRYNIKVAQKHNVKVKEDNSEKSFQEYIALTEETTKRQGFYAHSRKYHQIQWESFSHIPANNHLTSHILSASLHGKTLTTLLFFIFKDTLYYPYGASSNENRNVMHSTLAMWEGIQYGKTLGMKSFDMWGAAEVENPQSSNPYYGFHRFKQGFGAEYTEFIGSYDLVINPTAYSLYKVADKARWLYLRLKA